MPAELRMVADLLGLQATATRDVGSIDLAAPDLHAVFVSADGHDEAKALGRALRLLTATHLGDYGVLLGLVAAHEAVAITMRSELEARKLPVDNVVTLRPTAAEFARKLRAHEAGPSVGPTLVKGHQPDAADAILIRRAFHEFESVVLTEESGGFSRECRVWKVEAFAPGAAVYSAFVAKAALRGDLEREFSTYRAFVRDIIPFPFRAPLVEHRFVRGAKRALLVSAFVPRAQRLDIYLKSASSAEFVIVSLFEGALGNWRRKPETVTIDLGAHYVLQQKNSPASALLYNPDRLAEAFADSQRDEGVQSPEAIWATLEQLPYKATCVCLNHGDLNLRNVFVRWNSIDTVLIDYDKCGTKESLARDPAKLETSIALVASDANDQPMSADDLRALYAPPLLPARPQSFDGIRQDGRCDAIRQIRKQAAGEGIATAEYQILVICHLLRFAAKPTNTHPPDQVMRDRRALSYTLACQLLAHTERLLA